MATRITVIAEHESKTSSNSKYIWKTGGLVPRQNRPEFALRMGHWGKKSAPVLISQKSTFIYTLSHIHTFYLHWETREKNCWVAEHMIAYQWSLCHLNIFFGQTLTGHWPNTENQSASIPPQKKRGQVTCHFLFHKPYKITKKYFFPAPSPPMTFPHFWPRRGEIMREVKCEHCGNYVANAKNKKS